MTTLNEEFLATYGHDLFDATLDEQQAILRSRTVAELERRTKLLGGELTRESARRLAEEAYRDTLDQIAEEVVSEYIGHELAAGRIVEVEKGVYQRVGER